MIKTVEFKNFKALRDVKVKLEPLTLLVGPNASGKTSILEGLHYLMQLGAGPAAPFFVGQRHIGVLRSCGADGPMLLAMEGGADEAQFRSERSVIPDGKNWRFGGRLSWNGGTANFETDKPPTLPEPIQKALTAACSAALLHLDPRRLAEPSYSTERKPRVEFDGGNLGATLADIALTAPNALQELLKRVAAVVHIVDSISIQRATITKEEYVASKGKTGVYERSHATYQGYEVQLVLRGGGQVPARAVSEGTLITLGLLTVLSREPVPSLVMIDELERGLHPKALGELVRQIRALMSRFPDLQIIGTTHSPYLVDHFQPDEVRLTTLRDDGSVVVGSLNEHPDFDRWKDEMKPGEFWSTVGEDWLRDRKATDAQ